MKKVLIIEDELSLSNALSLKLKQEGLEVLVAENGARGLGVALKNHPDLILLDILMPIMDGITMLSKLRADEWGKSVPVIILTNLSDKEKIAESIELGANDYFIKADSTVGSIIDKVKEKLKI